MSLFPPAAVPPFDPSEAFGTKPQRFDSGVPLTKADHARLATQLGRIYDVMKDGRWRSVPDINVDLMRRFHSYEPEPSISAQIRNLKKPKHGGHHIERRRVGNQYEFRLVTEG